MKTYYYLDKQQQQQGPITIGELSKCIKTRNTPIWREDMSDWQAAGSVPELSSIFTPPPIPVITPPPIIQPSAVVTPPPVVSPPPIIQPSVEVTSPPVVAPPPIIQPSAVVTLPPVVSPPPIIQSSVEVTPPPVVSPPPIIQSSVEVTPPPIIQPSVEETTQPKPKVSIFLAPPQVSSTDLPQWQQAIKGIVAAQRELWGEELTAFVALEKLFNSANFESGEIGVHIQAIKEGIPEYDQNRLLKTHLENFVALYEKYFSNIPSKKLK